MDITFWCLYFKKADPTGKRRLFGPFAARVYVENDDIASATIAAWTTVVLPDERKVSVS